MDAVRDARTLSSREPALMLLNGDAVSRRVSHSPASPKTGELAAPTFNTKLAPARGLIARAHRGCGGGEICWYQASDPGRRGRAGDVFACPKPTDAGDAKLHVFARPEDDFVGAGEAADSSAVDVSCLKVRARQQRLDGQLRRLAADADTRSWSTAHAARSVLQHNRAWRPMIGSAISAARSAVACRCDGGDRRASGA
jgi:hypothetical protein